MHPPIQPSTQAIQIPSEPAPIKFPMPRPRRYRDIRTTTIPASPDAIWQAVLDQAEALGSPRYARMLGCRDTQAHGPRPLEAGSTVPGFQVTTARPPDQLVLEGVHRFSAYTLTFRLVPDNLVPDGPATRLEAHTNATFPGVRGALYRLLVIESRLHKLATWSIVERIRRRVLTPHDHPRT